MSDPTILTLDDLAARWQCERHRVLKRLRDCPMPAINLGTAKYPEWRFRLETVELWESQFEAVPDSSLGGEPDPDPARPTKRIVGRKLVPIDPADDLTNYGGTRRRSLEQPGPGMAPSRSSDPTDNRARKPTMQSFDRQDAIVERTVPQAGPEIRKALARHTATATRLNSVAGAYDAWNVTSNPRWPSDPAEATRIAQGWEEKVDRAAQTHIKARRNLFGMILAANGHDPESGTFPPCGISLGGRTAWLNPPESGSNMLNAELIVN